MDYLEINSAGNFTTWAASRLKELKEGVISKDLGQNLLFENENVRIWECLLLPNERLPFREIDCEYTWISLTKGMAISRYADGKIFLIRIEKGDSGFLEKKETSYTYDLENKGDDILFFQMTEFKNHPLKIKSLISESLKQNTPKDQ